MAFDQPDQLSRQLRLALAYAPAAVREATAAVFALDTRLARIGAQTGEPIIAQVKLAWWRDQFGKPVELWPRGEPLLAALADHSVDPARLVTLVDGWEALLASERIDETVADRFADGRAAAFLALAETQDENCNAAVRSAARQWALADLAAQLGESDARSSVFSLAECELGAVFSLPRTMRPLAVLDVLARRALQQRRGLLERPSDLLLAMRVGIFGR